MLDLIFDTVVGVFLINLPATGSSIIAALPTIVVLLSSFLLQLCGQEILDCFIMAVSSCGKIT
jgi:hypothetical protein